MSELWTPGSGDPRQPSSTPDGAPTGPTGASSPTPTAEELEAVRELHERLAATPVADVIVNHAIGIWQLALVHLGVVTPPGLSEQQRIADAFFAEGLLPIKVNAGDAKIWTPKRD